MGKSRLDTLQNELTFVRTVIRRFSQDRILVAAASLSYTSLLAVVPLFAIAFSVMMAFPVFDGLTQQLLNIILSYVAPHIGGELETYLDRFVSNTSQLTVLGVVWLAVTAIMLLSTIESAFNAIWRVEKSRPFAMRLLAYWTTLTLGPLLMGVGLSFSTALFAVNNFQALGVDISFLREFGLRLLPFAFAAGGFTTLYVVLPNRRVSLKYAVLGASVASVLFELLKYGFGFYLANAGTFESLYGSLAALPVFLIWMYLVWAVVLFGAIVAATRPEWQAAQRAEEFGPITPARALLRALQVLDKLLRAGQEGEKATEKGLLDATGGDGEGLSLVLARLEESNVIARTEADEPVIMRDLEGFTVSDLYTALGFGPGDAYRDEDEDARWTEPVAALVDAYNLAREETLGVLVKDIVAAARKTETTPRVVSENG